MARLLQSRLIGAFALLAAAAAQAQDVTVYDDALQNGFQNYSYGGQASDFDFASTAQAHGGTKSIAFVGDNYNAVSFAHPTQDFSTAQYPTLHFWVHGGTAGGQQLRLYLQLNDVIVAQAELDTYVAGGAIVAGAWSEVTVTLGQASLAYAGSFDRVDLQSDVGGGQLVLYIDDVSLVAGGPPPANLMQIERDVTVASMVSDRFTWSDGTNQPRVAVLAHNDGQVGPGSVRGGALREFRYQLPDGSTRIANVTTYGNGGYGGFGYVVSHASNYAGCVGDDSPLGDFFPGQYQRIFEGRHHVIFRFTQNYPRNCSTTAPVQARTIPVTIDWVFSTGRDNPVWAVTWDVDLAQPSAPVDTFWDDTRGPYGELNIDGDGWTNIDGVAWGDRYKFTSTSAPVTLASQWTYDVVNTVPYVKLWLAAPMVMPGHTKDATMGLVQTQTMTQQDAAGARIPGWHDITECWGKTSATCGWAGNPDVMPWQDDWAYQANADSIGGGANGNARLTWRTQYGFIGQATYVVHDGVVPDPPGRPGYPKKSYSTYVVLGTHSSAPVEAQVTQVETVQSLVLTPTTGSVVTSGPAGVARTDNVTYAPAGYNHVYGALAFTAAGNLLDANIAVGAGTLKKPLLILGAFTGALPAVKLGGVSLVQDVDYFPSLRAGASELWITLNRDLLGATNHLEVLPSCSPVPTPTIQASGPATFCAGGSVTLTASIAPGAGVSYLWSPGGETTQAINVTASGSYSVTVTVTGCAGTSPATVVTVNPAPTTPNIAAPASALAGATGLIASVPLHAGSSYVWGITNGTITAGAGTNQITFTAGPSGVTVLTVAETTIATGCASPAATANVYINAEPAGLVEDAHATGATISNVNKVLEPGETVLVNPSWKNITASPLALAGTASAFTGPAGATYSLLDSSAGYGTIAPGATVDSFTAGLPSYRLSVSNPATRPAAHWDATFLETLSNGIVKTWTLHVGQSFTDVPTSNVSYAFVENIFHNGITTGCAAGLYCPAVDLPRWQMATFLARSILGSGVTIPTSGTVSGVGSYDCTGGGTSLFTDVPTTNVACPAIHYIYSQGITTGCGQGIYCPNTLLPRWQMAVFLAHGMLGSGVPIPTSGTVSGDPYDCTGGGNSLFTDVTPTDVACPAIHYIYSQGVTTGCGPGIFCPNTLLPRWQMAILLVRAFQMPFLR